MQLHEMSSIPDDAAYWTSLTERVASGALSRRRNVVSWMSAAGGVWIAAALLLLAVAVGWVVESGRADRAPGDAVWTFAVAAPDRLASAFETSDTPPSVSALLFSGNAR